MRELRHELINCSFTHASTQQSFLSSPLSTEDLIIRENISETVLAINSTVHNDHNIDNYNVTTAQLSSSNATQAASVNNIASNNRNGNNTNNRTQSANNANIRDITRALNASNMPPVPTQVPSDTNMLRNEDIARIFEQQHSNNNASAPPVVGGINSTTATNGTFAPSPAAAGGRKFGKRSKTKSDESGKNGKARKFKSASGSAETGLYNNLQKYPVTLDVLHMCQPVRDLIKDHFSHKLKHK